MPQEQPQHYKRNRWPQILELLGLHRPELRAWAMYDWAITGMWSVIVAAIFPVYFQSVAAADLEPQVATQHFATATTIGLAIIALMAPFLGALTDHLALKKKMLGTFAGIGISAVACMFFIHEGDWMLAAGLFIFANIGANGSMVFYDALLPHIANKEEIDRVSTAGFAVGYAGAGLLLGFNLLLIMQPTWFLLPEDGTLPVRLGFITTALWWFGFAVPLFRRVPEPPVNHRAKISTSHPFKEAWSRLFRTFRELKSYKQAFLMLIAFLIYNDGIGTIIRMAAIYGAEIGIESNALIGAVLLVNFVGVPFTFLFAMVAWRLGTKNAIFVGLVIYTFISILGYFMSTTWHFFLLAFLVGMVQGGTQGLSRSLFASLIPRSKSGEFFGFFAVVEKFAGIFGPAIFAGMIVLTGTSQLAILSIIGFFIVGGFVLAFVNVDEGRTIALEHEARLSGEEPLANQL